MRSRAGFHSNTCDLEIGGESQELLAGKLVAHHNLASCIESHQVKIYIAYVSAREKRRTMPLVTDVHQYE